MTTLIKQTPIERLCKTCDIKPVEKGRTICMPCRSKQQIKAKGKSIVVKRNLVLDRIDDIEDKIFNRICSEHSILSDKISGALNKIEEKIEEVVPKVVEKEVEEVIIPEVILTPEEKLEIRERKLEERIKQLEEKEHRKQIEAELRAELRAESEAKKQAEKEALERLQAFNPAVSINPRTNGVVFNGFQGYRGYR